MSKQIWTTMGTVLGGVVCIVAFFVGINAVDTSSWGAISALTKSLVPLGIAVATAAVALHVVKSGSKGD